MRKHVRSRGLGREQRGFGQNVKDYAAHVKEKLQTRELRLHLVKLLLKGGCLAEKLGIVPLCVMTRTPSNRSEAAKDRRKTAKDHRAQRGKDKVFALTELGEFASEEFQHWSLERAKSRAVGSQMPAVADSRGKGRTDRVPSTPCLPLDRIERNRRAQPEARPQQFRRGLETAYFRDSRVSTIITRSMIKARAGQRQLGGQATDRDRGGQRQVAHR